MSNFHTNGHIFTHWVYFTQISNESQILTQMAIFSHIEHISHKYQMNVNFSHKWPYFHTLSIFHTNIQWKSNFHTNDHIFTHWVYVRQISNESLIFTQMVIFSHIGYVLHIIILLLSFEVLIFWNYWLFHGGRCASMKLHWPMVFLAWSSRWRKDKSHQIDQTLPHRRHSQLRWFIVF
jgi:hypothetical protein